MAGMWTITRTHKLKYLSLPGVVHGSCYRVKTMIHPQFLKLLNYIYFENDIIIHVKVKTATETCHSSSEISK